MIVSITGIQCDACDYANDKGNWGTTPEEIKATSESYLDKPCPKCGAPLLTIADHNALLSMLDLAPIITGLEEAMYPEGVPKDQMVKVPIEMDGTGKMNIEL